MGSIYKNFRTYKNEVPGKNTLSSRYDQPTYLTFKLVFGQNDNWYNSDVNYDRMPHPLFSPKGSDNVQNRHSYSAIDYLLDANEFTRAEMLKEFITKFNTLQKNFQWYFQKIDGVDTLLKINTKKGIRIPTDTHLTITTLDGLDLKMSYLLNLYRKIAWDDTYQRWVLPDMMRYFTLKIYVTEFRTFHKPSVKDSELYLDILDNILPTWVINCEMCEFDIENFDFDYMSGLSVANDPKEAMTKFNIKVGNIHEEQIYPIFKNMCLLDKSLNGFDRSKEFDSDTKTKYVSTYDYSDNNHKYYNYNLISQDIPNQTQKHISGMPFNQNTNQSTLPNYKFLESNKGWINNALDFGIAYGNNFVNKVIDKAKLTSIPKLGFSLSDVTAALQSKNVITALGTIRKAITTVTNDNIEPSSKLNSDITETTFRNFLIGISKSEATSDENKILKKGAIDVLNDNDMWERVKLYANSLDISSSTNSPDKIINKLGYKEAIEIEANNSKSNATDENINNIQKNIIIESPPSSSLIDNKIL